MLLAPVVFAAVFELTRIGAVGATVDGIHPGSPYGLIAAIPPSPNMTNGPKAGSCVTPTIVSMPGSAMGL
jgi:hypothetical protein